MTAATPLSHRPPNARKSHPRPAGRDASNRISATDWFSSAPLATLHSRLEAHTSRSQFAHRRHRAVGSHRHLTTCESTAASPFPASTARMAARLVPRRPAAVGTSSVSVAQCPGPAPEQLVRPPLGRMSRRQTPLSHFERRFRHPGAHHRSQERPAPCLTNVRNETPQGALPPTSPVARPKAFALNRTLEPPLLPGFATEVTASGGRSRLFPRAARLPRASVVHRASSATHRLSASAT